MSDPAAVVCDLTQRSTGVALLSRLVPKVDPGREGAHVWDCDLLWSEVDEDDAAAADVFLPGAERQHALARDKKGSYTTIFKPATKDFTLTVQADGATLVDGLSGELRQATGRFTERGGSVVWRVRLHGVEPEQSSALLACLGQLSGVTTEPAQQVFPFPSNMEPQKGDLITGRDKDTGAIVHGFVVTQSVGDDAKLLLNDFGTDREVLPTDVVSCLRMRGERLLLKTMLRRYEDGLPKGEDATCKAVVVAVASMVGDGSAVRDGDELVVGDGLVSLALAYHEDNEELPAEAGTA